VEGNQIIGTAKLTPGEKEAEAVTVPWRARRSERSDYFAPTGTAMFQPPAQVP
jgi:hypothetical protein